MKTRLLLALLSLVALSGCGQVMDRIKGEDTTVEETDTAVEDGAVAGNQVSYTINYDTSKWFTTPTDAGADAEYEFEHMDGDVYAMVIPERIELSTDALKEAALANAQAVAPDAEIVFEETRNVNGVDMLAMKIQGTIYGVAFQYYGYYYGGSAGTLQFITYTSQNLVDTYEEDMTELLNGLTIIEE